MAKKADLNPYFNGPMWKYFKPSSNYMVIPRTLLCGMPEKWQENFAKLMDEVRGAYDPEKIRDKYAVNLRDDKGRFMKDPLADYRHPGELPYRPKKKERNVTQLIEEIVTDLLETKQAGNVSDAHRIAVRIVGKE